jgi:phenylpropionate dioxygenase-like ring-hydroxylating dioxygenase large terminal subunit
MDLSDFKSNPDLSRASTLPARWYLDPQLLELEKEKIFWRTWQPVGRLDTVQRVGDFFSCEILGEPLVVTHGSDQVLRALSNVCRHRAGVLAVGKGNRRSLQCRYHGWTYSLDGKLFAQPEFEGVNDWNKNEICLPQYRVESWGPFIFTNLASKSVPFSEFLGEIPAEVNRAGFHIDQMHFLERRDYLVNCNWKVYIDNYLEGYHIPIAHPGLFREVDYEQYRVDTYRYYSQAHAPIRKMKDGELAGRDRRYVRTEAESKALYYWIFPNWMINIYPDNLQINIILPLSHDKTLTIFEWYFSDPGTPEGWESMQSSIGFADQVQQEDILLCEQVQKGLQSRTYNQGRLSVKRENGVHHFHHLVHEFLTQGPR